MACEYRGLALNQEHMRARNMNRQCGFTLVETLIASSVLGIMVVSLCSAYTFGFRVIRVSQENQRADQIMLQKLELLRVYGWSRTCSNGFVPATFTDSFSPGSSRPGVTYSGTILVTNAPISASYSNQLRLVTVTLNWSSSGRPCSQNMSTLVAQYGIQTYKN
ncbi:MAG: hypothetical protein C5B50_00565 [Verrucomicrobia bacterium]|nr:MAG: hypothetical protein C5B50_00565 [Verrucomicrobiota bacterium]